MSEAQQPYEVAGQNLDWSSLGFGLTPTRGHIKHVWKDGEWDAGELVAEPYLNTHIFANVFHYGQAVFEGQKAYHCKDGKVRVFNDKMNYQRISASARRMAMVEIPEELWFSAIDRVINENLDFMPPYGSDCAIYLRPNLIGTGPALGIAPASEFTFIVSATPVGAYYKTGKLTPIPCCVMDDFDRAAPLGVGACKCAGNYGADIMPGKQAKERGFPIGLYLDAKEHKYIEEFNTSNFVAITADGKYLTPDSPSVLPSITNKCLEQLAVDMGLTVERRQIDFEAEIRTFKEVGAVGTAVVITPIGSITRGDTKYEFDAPDVLQKLHDQVRAIQVGDQPDKHGWLRVVGERP